MSERNVEKAERKPTWLSGWRIGSPPRRRDWFAHLLCLLVGHAWTVNGYGTQRVCDRCWWCQDQMPMRLMSPSSIASVEEDK